MTPAEIAAGYGPEGVTSYDARIMPNTIDPDVFYDKRGKLWMVYGSYSGGIFILEMDETTGKPRPGQGYGKHLAGGDHAQIEGAVHALQPGDPLLLPVHVVRRPRGERRLQHPHRALAKVPTGPFLDAEGRDMVNARGN